jgi:hypothetical protein
LNVDTSAGIAAILPHQSHRIIHHHSSSISAIINHPTLYLSLYTVMAISSHVALNKVSAGGIGELDAYITKALEARSVVGEPDAVRPVGLHFVVDDKIFRGTNHKFLCCPVQLLLRDGSGQTKLCTPVWTHQTLRAKVNRKVKVGTKKLSVIRLDDFNAVAHDKSPSGHVFLIRSYLVVKKDVDEDAYLRWRTEN